VIAIQYRTEKSTIRFDSKEEFNVDSKAEISLI